MSRRFTSKRCGNLANCYTLVTYLLTMSTVDSTPPELSSGTGGIVS